MQTDLNQRERRKYAEQFRAMGKTCDELAQSIEAEDDSKALVHFMILAFASKAPMDEFTKIMLDAAEVEKAKKSLADGEAP